MFVKLGDGDWWEEGVVTKMINNDGDNDDGDNNDNDDDVNDRMVLLQSSHHQASLPSTTSAALRCVRHHPYQSFQHYCKQYIQKKYF